jgi:CheY-like chemotaxis protein
MFCFSGGLMRLLANRGFEGKAILIVRSLNHWAKGIKFSSSFISRGFPDYPAHRNTHLLLHMTTQKSLVRLLHLEDNPRAAQLVQERLEADHLACEITHVKSRAQFESIISKRNFDLVLCDYNLPDYDGFAAMRRVRRAQPEVPVIFISGAMGDDPSEQCRSHGAGYVRKYELETLVPAMKRALRPSGEKRREVVRRRPILSHLSLEPCAVAA